MKINVDAAISKNMVTASVAAVARDQTGKFLGAAGVVLEGTTDVETAEAIACREGLVLASNLYWKKST
jgi:ribonuclease HI